MKPIKLFYQARYPFCKRAFNYIDELKKRPEYKDIVIETIFSIHSHTYGDFSFPL